MVALDTELNIKGNLHTLTLPLNSPVTVYLYEELKYTNVIGYYFFTTFLISDLSYNLLSE